MEPDKTIEEYTIKDKKFIIRTPRPSDINDILSLINSIVEEDAPIMLNEKQTYIQEVSWLYNEIKEMLNDNTIAFVVEYNGKIIADASIKRKPWREKYVGNLGISILKEYRNIGLGYKLIDMLLKFAKNMDFKIITLDVYSNNPAGIHLYKKLGFKEVGMIPKCAIFKDKLIDDIKMYKEL